MPTLLGTSTCGINAVNIQSQRCLFPWKIPESHFSRSARAKWPAKRGKAVPKVPAARRQEAAVCSPRHLHGAQLRSAPRTQPVGEELQERVSRCGLCALESDDRERGAREEGKRRPYGRARPPAAGWTPRGWRWPHSTRVSPQERHLHPLPRPGALPFAAGTFMTTGVCPGFTGCEALSCLHYVIPSNPACGVNASIASLLWGDRGRAGQAAVQRL